MTFQSQELLKQSEVLKRLKIGRTAWDAGVKAGRFPQPIVFGPRSKRYHPAVIEKLLQELSGTGG